MGSTEYIVLWVGSKLKEARKVNNLKLNDLSERTGISIAMLSKIENGRVFPTLPSLLQIFRALDLDLNSFFADLPGETDFNGYVHCKRSDYKRIDKEDDSVGFSYDLILKQTMEKSALELSLLTLSPNAKRHRVATDGMQFLFIIKGEVTFNLGNEKLILQEQDSLFYDGRLEHVPENHQDQDAILLVAYFLTIN